MIHCLRKTCGLFLSALIAGISPAAENPTAELQRLHQQIQALYKSAKDAEAISLAQAAAALSEQIHGPDHPDNAESLYDLARGYTRTGQFSRAEPLYRRILKIREKAFGAGHPQTATALHSLGWFYADLAKYDRAETLLQRALEIRRRHFGPEHPATAESLNSLAVLHQNIGNYAKAEALYQQAMEIQKKTLGAQHTAVATTLNNLATLYWTLGEYAMAEENLGRALAIRKETLGPEHPYTVTSLNNLALLYRSIGSFVQAEPIFKRVLKIRKKTLGPDHPFTITSISHLGLLYADQGNDAAAEPLLARSLEMREKTLGPDHPDTARTLNDLALLFDRTGDHARAEPLFRRALESRQKVLGARHAETAVSLRSLACHYHALGDAAQAETLYRQALDICETQFGLSHPETLKNLECLARLELETGRTDLALDHAREMIRGREKCLGDVCSFASEQQRLEFHKTLNLYSLPASLGCAHDIAETVFRTKGFVLDSFMEEHLAARASRDPEIKSLLDQLRAVSRRLTRSQIELFAERAEDLPTPRQDELDLLEKKRRQLEADFSRRVFGAGNARRALRVTTEQVQEAIPRDAALIEFIRYDHDLGGLRFEGRYGAVVLRHEGEPQWTPLGKATEIESQIELYQRYVRRRVKQAALTTALQTLYQQVWAALEPQIGLEIRRVIISPDAELNFISFATLLAPDKQFLCQKFEIEYVTSGRDLLWLKPAPAASKDLAVFANPDFSAKWPSSARQDDARTTMWASPISRNLPRQRLTPLPGTEREARFLKHQAESWGLVGNFFIGARASEAALDQLEPPRILHLATHGFFLPQSEIPNPKSEILQSPMQRSILALAGAQRTFDAWEKGRIPPADNDGVVTAQEVGSLDLQGTWLVVLSGCDTGSGEARAGEGVLGLRRGFIQAGAENLLMTLWPVGDSETVAIIQDFYSQALKGGDAPQAFANVQRDWLVQLRQERGLSLAVRLAGPFILTFQERSP
ncbi:MAG: CHAT domain-containing protein [Verrucomicrobia bacterium]|nr:CHAT domain-containing protein [Verrucomicrobiota bacterium]